jgi:Flp pilus assembly pilin Flp
MKPRKLLPQNKFLRLLVKSERGQSIVEFVLLLAVITGLSYGFVAMMNNNLAKYWQYAANLVVDDKPGTKTVKLRP